MYLQQYNTEKYVGNMLLKETEETVRKIKHKLKKKRGKICLSCGKVYNVGARYFPLELLEVGFLVMFQERPNLKSKIWTNGSVIATEGLHSYNITAADRRLYRQNRRFMRTSKNP